jgi:hypothetical protein
MKKADLNNLFDLASFDTILASDKGAEVELVHLKDGAPTGIFFRVLGPDSSVWREQVNERANKRLAAQFKAQRGGSKAQDVPTMEDATADGILLLTRCTIGWRTVTAEGEKPVLILNGDELPFNAVNCARIYTDLPAVRDQIDTFIGDIANFL